MNNELDFDFIPFVGNPKRGHNVISLCDKLNEHLINFQHIPTRA